MTRVARRTDRPFDPLDMNEAELQRQIIVVGRDSGWGVTAGDDAKLIDEAEALGIEPPGLDGLIYHPAFSVGSEKGWPDLTMFRLRDARIIFAELKSQKRDATPRQARVLDLLRAFAGDYRTLHGGVKIEVFLWRPSDLPSVYEVLR